MTGLWAAIDTALGIANVMVRLGAPLTAFLVAARFASRRKGTMWRGLALFFAFILVSGAWAEFLNWTSPRYLNSLMERGLPIAQIGYELAKRQIPVLLVDLTAWLWLVGVLIRLLCFSLAPERRHPAEQWKWLAAFRLKGTS